MRIAIAQTCPFSADPGPHTLQNSRDNWILSSLVLNCCHAEDRIKEAKAGGADVVCFPEYFLQGILNEGRQYLSLASNHLEDLIAHYAKANDICVTGTIVHGSSSTLPPLPTCSPFPLTIDEDSDIVQARRWQWDDYLLANAKELADDSHFTLINEAFFIDRTGKKTGKYTKKNLWHPEREYLEAGTVEEPLFDTPWGKAGFLICWDLSHPAAAQQLADQGADIIFAPAYWLATDSEPMTSKYTSNPNYELDLVQSLCYARAFETETVLIHTNAGGPGKEAFMGGSGVWAPLMGKVRGFEGGTAGLEIVELDMGVLADARDTYKIREDAAIRNGS